MTTTADRPSALDQPDVRVTANRLRTILGWLDDNADWLPAGNVAVRVTSLGDAEVWWHDHGNVDQGAVAEVLAYRFGPGDTVGPSTEWEAEGSRPRLVVYNSLAAAPGGAA